MKNLILFVSVILLLTASALYGQKGLYIGMPANEFKAQLPGILPDTMTYNESLHLKERLYKIGGEWSFGFHSNSLTSAVFNNECHIESDTVFNSWINSAKSVIADYTKLYGPPVKSDQGSNKYADRNNVEYEASIGKREVFYEAIWETRTMQIMISCDYRSNYYEEFMEGIPNGPTEWYSYSFIISYKTIPFENKRHPDESGRFYLGMNVNDFAKVFPSLFPEGIGLTGQWSREETIHGLAGEWYYEFKNGKLNWMMFDKYIDDINDTNFNKCLTITRQMIKDYSVLYGKPDTTITGNTHFVDPKIKRHWGYDVVEARWKNYKGMKMKIEFTFMGGKGDYHFLVTINHFDKDYPYYD